MDLLKKVVLLFLTFFLVSPKLILAFDIPNRPSGFVSDFANLYSANFKNQLENNLSDFEKQTTAEIAVVTVPSLGGSTIEELATNIFDKWKIGKKGRDNGVLLLVSKNDRKVRIEVGYGLEPVITDGRSGRIIREQISPHFKNEDFEGGTQAAISQLESYISSNKGPDQIENLHAGLKDTFWPITKVVTELLLRSGLIILIFPILAYLVAFMARSKNIWAGGVVGGFLGFLLGLALGTLLALILSTSILALLGILLDFLLSRNYRQRTQKGHPTDFWSSGGGFWGSSGFGSGGFGGFGGGSSGGGGASGDW